MQPKVTLIFLILLALFSSCKKKESLEINNSPGGLLNMVKYGSELWYVYTWNNNNLIDEEKSRFFYTKHNYNRNNQLVSSDFYVDPAIYSSSSYVLDAAMKRTEWVNPDNTAKENSNTFEYNRNGQLIKRTILRLNTNYQSYATFEYNSSGQICKETWYYENKEQGYRDYVYDSAGNLISEKRYDLDSVTGKYKPSTTTIYEFDNSHNPYRSFNRQLPGLYTNQNNIVKETYEIHFEVDASIKKIQITETTYEYNSSGYPVKKDGIIEFVYN